MSSPDWVLVNRPDSPDTPPALETPTPNGSNKILLLCSKLFDPESGTFFSSQTIEVCQSSGLIVDVRSTLDEDYNAEKTIDLRQLTVLPGFVDAHVHLFLHPYSEVTWLDQVTRESVGERIVRAVNHAKATLLAGWTSVRDLGTEGCEEADVALRKVISAPLSLIPGPRYFVATRGISSTGSYGPKTELHPAAQNVDGQVGTDVVDGVDECQKIVRRQIGAGADVIKFYGDYGFRQRMGAAAPKIAAANRPLFTPAEAQAMITTAHSLGVKVAAHASLPSVIKMCSQLGVNTIEHGFEADIEALEAMRDNGVTFVPTLAAYYTISKGRWEKAAEMFKRALSVKGLKIAVGGDTGVFSHGANALEAQLMLDLGMPWKDVIYACTCAGWACLRSSDWDGEPGQARLAQLAADVLMSSESLEPQGDNDVPFGCIKGGFAADIIATSGNLETDAREAISAGKIAFVMKGGKVYKMDGVPV